MIRVGILGSKAFTAGEALRWLARHPEVELTALMARVEEAEPIENYFPELSGVVKVKIEPVDLDLMAQRCDAVVLTLPHTTSQEYAPRLLELGLKIIDLSADFRFDSVEQYEKTYGVKHLAPTLNDRLPYALPELFRDDLADADGLALPGCYPTATLLGLAPVCANAEHFDLDHVVTNAMSGTSGAGRSLSERTMFVSVNESVSAYSVGGHRHRPEIEEKLERVAGIPVQLTFTTHLLPITRGILATTTVPLRSDLSTEDALGLYHSFYKSEPGANPFVRLSPAGQTPSIAQVAYSNFCDIGVVVDTHTRMLIIISVIDNLAKGAASQGVQAMNILFGLPETTGLIG